MTIDTLVAEFSRLDPAAENHYVAHEGDEDVWPCVGFREDATGNSGHPVLSVHPSDMADAVESLRQWPDGAANLQGPESLLYQPKKKMKEAGVRCTWHV